jgi:hypothetical protein
MRCLDRYAGQCVTVLVAGLLLTGTAAAAKPDKLAAVIEHRLAGAGNVTFPMASVSDYFPSKMTKPKSGFYMYACTDSGQPFRFSVAIYRTVAEAATAYQQGIDHVRAIGGDFHAFFQVRSGRVLYMGSTAGGPSPSNPPLPLKAFHGVVGLAQGASWARGQGCRPTAPLPTSAT